MGGNKPPRPSRSRRFWDRSTSHSIRVEPTTSIPRTGFRSSAPPLRTTSIEAFSAAADTVGDIDTDQLAKSMETLSQAFSETPGDVRASLDGVSRLSQTIASRDQDLKKLFAATGKTSQVLADRNKEFTQLIR